MIKWCALLAPFTQRHKSGYPLLPSSMTLFMLRKVSQPEFQADMSSTFIMPISALRVCCAECCCIFFPTPPFLHARVAKFLFFLLCSLVVLAQASICREVLKPNSGFRPYFRQSRILTIRLPFVFNNTLIIIMEGRQYLKSGQQVIQQKKSNLNP